MWALLEYDHLLDLDGRCHNQGTTSILGAGSSMRNNQSEMGCMAGKVALSTFVVVQFSAWLLEAAVPQRDTALCFCLQSLPSRKGFSAPGSCSQFA